MKINVQKVIEMWEKKKFTSEERKKDFKSIINYYDNITNFTDLGLLTININSRNAGIFQRHTRTATLYLMSGTDIVR